MTQNTIDISEVQCHGITLSFLHHSTSIISRPLLPPLILSKLSSINKFSKSVITGYYLYSFTIFLHKSLVFIPLYLNHFALHDASSLIQVAVSCRSHLFFIAKQYIVMQYIICLEGWILVSLPVVLRSYSLFCAHVPVDVQKLEQGARAVAEVVSLAHANLGGTPV